MNLFASDHTKEIKKLHIEAAGGPESGVKVAKEVGPAVPCRVHCARPAEQGCSAAAGALSSSFPASSSS